MRKSIIAISCNIRAQLRFDRTRLRSLQSHQLRSRKTFKSFTRSSFNELRTREKTCKSTSSLDMKASLSTSLSIRFSSLLQLSIMHLNRILLTRYARHSSNELRNKKRTKKEKKDKRKRKETIIAKTILKKKKRKMLNDEIDRNDHDLMKR